MYIKEFECSAWTKLHHVGNSTSKCVDKDNSTENVIKNVDKLTGGVHPCSIWILKKKLTYKHGADSVSHSKYQCRASLLFLGLGFLHDGCHTAGSLVPGNLRNE